MASVKIALRVRPLSEKELSDDGSSRVVVDVEDDNTVAITNLKVPTSNAGDSRARVKRFSFDYCFESSRSDQERVYNEVSKTILDSVAKGRDACVLAYGQSSSGKTYTMQGTSTEPGLAPRLCRTLAEDDGFEAVVSFFEIYNERVRDLLAAEGAAKNASSNRRELRVREHPKRGPYVEALSGVSVKSGEEVCALWWDGARRRRTASTATNSASSRSHALLSIRRTRPDPPVNITLLDLAGSERPSSVNQSLPRQKEGANINKSLVALANVISALVAGASSKNGRYVPYRDSVLTWLLKDTLGGCSTTVMIATVSPSASCYSETINTMRWASRAARIPANNGRGLSSELPHDRAIRQLKAEIARLKALLATAFPENIPKDSNAQEIPMASNSVEQEKPIEEHVDTSEISESTLKEEDSTEIKQNENEETDSLDSLNSSRISIGSVDTLSGNNSVPANLTTFKEEDVYFGPILERTGSVHDVKPTVPLRNKARQYSSHEGLSIQNKGAVSRPTPIPKINYLKKSGSSALKLSPSKSESIVENNKDNTHKGVILQPFNKRAKIVASVTDRLYSKLKIKDENNVTKITTPPTERKPSQNLNELQLCNNARKKLLDLSHKALWASRRTRPGVAVETQTEKPSALRVKNASTDIPNDLEPFQLMTNSNKQYKHAAVCTERQTKLCKEVSVGEISGSVHIDDKCVETDITSDSKNALIITRTCGNNTEDFKNVYSAATQTQDASNDTKKCSSFTKYLKFTHQPSISSNESERSTTGVLNISISHDCGQVENEIDAISDDSLENDAKNLKQTKQEPTAPPDLLHNHNSSDTNDAKEYVKEKLPTFPKEREKTESKSTQVYDSDEAVSEYIDFLDDAFVPLPRIYFRSEYTRWPTMKNLIMGRNPSMFPYNIKTSPRRERLPKKRNAKTVTWKSDNSENIPIHACCSGKSIMKKPHHHTAIDTDSDDTPDSDEFVLHSDHNTRQTKKTKYFKGIHCWDERTPTKIKTHRKKLDTKKCAEYTEATKDFLNEATNLVSALSAVSNRLMPDKNANVQFHSPICNDPLHIIEGDDDDDQIKQLEEYFEKRHQELSDSRFINHSKLVKCEESKSNNLFTYKDDWTDVENAEKCLTDSLNELERCTNENKEYFSTIGKIYAEKYHRTLSPIPAKRRNCLRKSPREYLQELVDIRREMVDETKKDENISKKFQS